MCVLQGFRGKWLRKAGLERMKEQHGNEKLLKKMCDFNKSGAITLLLYSLSRSLSAWIRHVRAEKALHNPVLFYCQIWICHICITRRRH